MGKFTYHNKAFTLIELLVYLGIISIVLILFLTIMYGIIYYTTFYFEGTLMKNEMFKTLQKIYFNAILAKSIETTSSSIKFIRTDQSYEKIFASGTNLYLDMNNLIDKFTSDKIKLKDFKVSTSGPFINVYINLSNLKESRNLSATSVIYQLSF